MYEYYLWLCEAYLLLKDFTSYPAINRYGRVLSKPSGVYFFQSQLTDKSPLLKRYPTYFKAISTLFTHSWLQFPNRIFVRDFQLRLYICLSRSPSIACQMLPLPTLQVWIIQSHFFVCSGPFWGSSMAWTTDAWFLTVSYSMMIMSILVLKLSNTHCENCDMK
jgi:hypothetical protein